MQKSENYLSETTLKGTPLKRLFLNLKENSVTTSKIVDDAITNEKIADSSISLEKLDENLKNLLAGKYNTKYEDINNLDALTDPLQDTGVYYVYTYKEEDATQVVGILLSQTDYGKHQITQHLFSNYNMGKSPIYSDNAATYYKRHYGINSTVIKNGDWTAWENAITSNVDLKVIIKEIQNNITTVQNDITVLKDSLASEHDARTETEGQIYAQLQETNDTINAIKNGDKPLVTPAIKPSLVAYLWQVFKADGTSVAPLTDKSINTIYGYKVNFIGSMSWSSADGYKNPTAMNGGDWSGVALPADGELSEAVKYSDIVADKTITASIKAPKQGLVYKNGIIKWADSADVSTASTYARVHFQYKVVATQVVSEVTQSALENLLTSTYALQDGRSKTLTGVTTSSAQYYVYAYPSKLGKLTKIVMNDATPLLDGGFTLSTISVVDPITKASIEYYVYTSVQKGAFTNVKLTIE